MGLKKGKHSEFRETYDNPQAQATTIPAKKRAKYQATLDRVECVAVGYPPLGGGRSSMVEPQIVILVVAGSNPVGHPTFPLPFRFN